MDGDATSLDSLSELRARNDDHNIRTMILNQLFEFPLSKERQKENITVMRTALDSLEKHAVCEDVETSAQGAVRLVSVGVH